MDKKVCVICGAPLIDEEAFCKECKERLKNKDDKEFRRLFYERSYESLVNIMRKNKMKLNEERVDCVLRKMDFLNCECDMNDCIEKYRTTRSDELLINIIINMFLNVNADPLVIMDFDIENLEPYYKIYANSNNEMFYLITYKDVHIDGCVLTKLNDGVLFNNLLNKEFDLEKGVIINPIFDHDRLSGNQIEINYEDIVLVLKKFIQKCEEYLNIMVKKYNYRWLYSTYKPKFKEINCDNINNFDAGNVLAMVLTKSNSKIKEKDKSLLLYYKDEDEYFFSLIDLKNKKLVESLMESDSGWLYKITKNSSLQFESGFVSDCLTDNIIMFIKEHYYYDFELSIKKFDEHLLNHINKIGNHIKQLLMNCFERNEKTDFEIKVANNKIVWDLKFRKFVDKLFASINDEKIKSCLLLYFNNFNSFINVKSNLIRFGLWDY